MRKSLFGLALSVIAAGSSITPSYRASSPEPRKLESNKPSKKRNKVKSARKQKHRK